MPLRVLLFGSPCWTTEVTLEALLAVPDVEIVGVVVGQPPDPGRSRGARRAVPPGAASRRGEPARLMHPPASPATPLTLRPEVTPLALRRAWAHGLRVIEVSRPRAPQVRETLAALAPDLLCVACFPHRIPGAVLELAPAGGFNVHPSLLPDLRGPAPLFWAFRLGRRRSGVSVHCLSEAIDAGDLVGQRALALHDGVRGGDVEACAARIGAELLVAAIGAVACGSLVPVPQAAVTGTDRAPWPTLADHRVPATWAARWAFNFIRGVAGWAGRLSVQAGSETLAVRDALAFGAGPPPGVPRGRPWSEGDGEGDRKDVRVVRFRGGWVRVITG